MSEEGKGFPFCLCSGDSLWGAITAPRRKLSPGDMGDGVEEKIPPQERGATAGGCLEAVGGSREKMSWLVE